jgi:hypothetical protein
MVGHHVVGVGPDAIVWIVAEIFVEHGKRVAEVLPGGIGRLGDSHTLIEETLLGGIEVGVRGGSELRDQPPVGQFVIEHDRVAGILRFARAAETGPKRIDVGGARDRRGYVVGAVERPDLIARIDRLNVLIVTDGAVVVRREAPRPRYSLKIETGGGSGRRRRCS